MNGKLSELILELDKSQEAMSENDIALRIKNITFNDQSMKALAEKIAFDFCEDYPDNESSWGTYYGPMIVIPKEDNKVHEYPSITMISKEIIEYWLDRAKITDNSLLKSRYLGLIWDLSIEALGEKADYTVAIDYVNALIDTVDSNLCKHTVDSVKKVTRAYKVASSINNIELIKRSIESAISLEDRIAEDSFPGLWGFCFDLFILEKCRYLSVEQSNKLLADLELRLDRSLKNNSLTPWISEAAALPLATYYRSKGEMEDVERVIKALGRKFEDSCDGLLSMQAAGLLHHVHEIYINFNMKDDAERIAKKILEYGQGVLDDMQVHTHSVKIEEVELEKFLNNLVSGELSNSLQRIAGCFIPRKNEVEQQVLDLVKSYPISYLFDKKIQSYDGNTIAIIGQPEKDLEGNIVHQLSQNMTIQSYFLRQSFNRLSAVYGDVNQELIDHIFNSPIFEETKREIILVGIQSYLNKDYISAIHLLIPQAEAAVRKLIELMGGSTSKRNRLGGFQLKTFDELLRDENIEKCFDTDVSFYFRTLLTDQRGWNLRNDVCHGICPSTVFNYAAADRIMHVILCLALVREGSISGNEEIDSLD